jgi:hypothetical protein
LNYFTPFFYRHHLGQIPASDTHEQSANGAVLGIFLDDNERVEWVYTILPDGRKIVTGYDIRPFLPNDSKPPALRKAEERRPKEEAIGRSAMLA